MAECQCCAALRCVASCSIWALIQTTDVLLKTPLTPPIFRHPAPQRASPSPLPLIPIHHFLIHLLERALAVAVWLSLPLSLSPFLFLSLSPFFSLSLSPCVLFRGDLLLWLATLSAGGGGGGGGGGSLECSRGRSSDGDRTGGAALTHSSTGPTTALVLLFTNSSGAPAGRNQTHTAATPKQWGFTLKSTGEGNPFPLCCCGDHSGA